VWEINFSNQNYLLINTLKMSELKELSNKIRSEALSGGVNEKRLDSDIRPSYLPPKGKFVGYEIANPNQPTAHIRVIADDGSSISIGTLKALAFFGKMESAKFRKVDNPDSPVNGGYVLVGTQPVNPNLGGKMTDVVARLIDREFEATPESAITLSVKNEGGKVVPYLRESDAMGALINKTFYKVTLIK
jgi:hypothetical protein